LSAPFVLFGPAHLTALALAFLLPLALSLFTRGHPARDRAVRWLLAAFLAGEWLGFYALFWARGWLDWNNALPMSLCDWAEAILIVALLKPGLRTYELGYFWGLAGTLQGLLYLTLGTGLRPVPASLPRVIAASLFYAVVAGAVDYTLGANYGYLHDKGGHVSLLTLLAPWPWYIGELVLIGFLSIAVYYAPFFVMDFFKGRTAQARTRPI
jgi:uncharacterized membrane protein YwaF